MKLLKSIAVGAAVALACGAAHAQYYQIANQLTNLITPALSGSLSYKGFVELDGIGGVGPNRANFIGINTTQGFQYASWFYMGVGMGIDVAMARNVDQAHPDGGYYGLHTSKTMAMLPLFSDFRFNFGPSNGVSAFLDAKVGAAWFLGDNYLGLYDRCMGHGAQFFLQPTLGVRIPVSATNPDHAMNIGVSYRLITSNNNYSWNSNTATLNGFGVSVAYEW